MAKAYTREDSPFVWITYSLEKKRYREKTIYTVDKLEFVKKEIIPELNHRIRTGKFKVVDKKTFEYYSHLMLKSKVYLKDTSYYTIEKKVAIWNEHFKGRFINEIKASEIKNFLLDKNIKLSSMKKYMYVIRQIFEEALLDEEVENNPVDKIRLPKDKPKEIRPFDKDEVNALLANATGYFKNMLAVCFYTGIRTGEMLAMKWQNIDFNKKRICIDSTVGNYKESNTTKTGKIRYVPIFDVLIPYLKDQEKKTGLQTYVFSSHLGTTLKPSNVYQYEWLPLLKRTKVPRRRLYDTRHTFATNMLDSKMFTLNQISSWLGHNSVQTLIRHYNKFIDSEISKFDSNFDVFDTKNDTEILESRYKGA